jgi:predicted transcriptional regulator
MTPENAAAALLEKAGFDLRVEIPIDVQHLAEEVENLDVQEHADLTTVEGAPSLPAGATLSGLLIPATRRVWVNAVEAQRSAGRRRFTIAHELGHWRLHSNAAGAHTRFCRSDEIGASQAEARAARQIEREANRFAAALLMPEARLREEAPKHHLNVKVLADRFGVSVAAMQVRLEGLDLMPDYMKR